MAIKAKDGSLWTNASGAAKANLRFDGDKKDPAKKIAVKTPALNLEKTEADVDNGPTVEDESDPKSVVAAHGPASSVTVKKDDLHEGQHHVHSTHEDGHRHHSVHDSADDALDSAKTLVGSNDSEDEDPSEETSEDDQDAGQSEVPHHAALKAMLG